MSKSKSKIFYYIAGVLFLVQVISVVISALDNFRGRIEEIIPLIASLGLVITTYSCFVRNHKILTISIIGVSVLGIIEGSMVWRNVVFQSLAAVVSCICLIMAIRTPPKGIVLGITSAIALLIPNILWGGSGYFSPLSVIILGIGLYFEYSEQQEALVVENQQNDTAVCSPMTDSNNGYDTPSETNIDRLVKLRDLLDKGIISQEDFDTKKSEILGS